MSEEIGKGVEEENGNERRNRLLKMGVLSNRISREELKPGDHIYSWRHAYIYAHHGSILTNLTACISFSTKIFLHSSSQHMYVIIARFDSDLITFVLLSYFCVWVSVGSNIRIRN